MPNPYPKVSERAWRTLRAKASTAPSTKFTGTFVATALGMASPRSAVDNAVAPMKRLGLIDDDGALTARGNKWRVDASYAEACDEILHEVYPEELAGFTNADGTPDGAAIKTWFQHQGFGNSNAGNMASTYVLIASRAIPEAPAAENGRKTPVKKTGAAAPAKKSAPVHVEVPASPPAPATTVAAPSQSSSSGPNLHLDIQIHIPAEATLEQIDQIFQSMGTHLYGRGK